LGCKPGLAFNPKTPLTLLPFVQDKIDLILLMSVNPGFSGQTFMPSVLEKAKEARHFINQQKTPIRLEMDGGIHLDNLVSIARAGVDTFVAGSAIFGSKNY